MVSRISSCLLYIGNIIEHKGIKYIITPTPEYPNTHQDLNDKGSCYHLTSQITPLYILNET